MKEEILNLGKLLVNELGLESSVDTLSRWMAHYIAEKMQLVESIDDDEERKLAEEKCFETILKLWKHMRYYNGNSRPFEKFEPIFKTLDKLDPDNRSTYYFQDEYSRKNNSEDDIVTKYLSLATSVDEVARVWLTSIFQLAAEAAIDDKTKEWIEAVLPLEDNSEATLIVRILSKYETNDYDYNQENRIKQLERRIEQLEDFKTLNDELTSVYKKEIESLKFINQ